MKKKILPTLLYGIPIVFFIVSYFIIITSGEDIWQGAQSNIDIIGDSIAAFNHSVRLADMFAWAIINFFDYTYSFGPDTILRLFDIALAFSIFYMATYIVLQRKPRFVLKDSAIFCSIFLLVFATSNGLTLYAGFSKIHNYLFITFFSLLFGIFYLRDLWGKKSSENKLFPLFMLILGFLFGFASNVTAIIFILSLPFYALYLHITHQKIPFKTFFTSWRFAGVIGILLSIILMYVIGNGLGDYDTNPVYLIVCDYIPLPELLAHPFDYVGRLIWHNVYNFGRFLIPFVVAIIPFAIYSGIRHYKPNFHVLKPHKNYLVASLIFIFMHIFALSQIVYPTRLVLPAYIFACSIFIFIFDKLFFTEKPLFNKKSFIVLSSILLILAIGITAIRSYFAISYVSRINPILEEIKNSDSDTYCVNLKTATAEYIPYFHFGQEDFLVDWAMPQQIYGKTIYYCD
ncbi:hypothetical protein IJH74_02675 [Candidatus Saccharibacteria bacterium]|nr:hypothetical protein [Candidatus Saccharibacteria bacterium]